LHYRTIIGKIALCCNLIRKIEVLYHNLARAHPEREHFEILVKNLARPNLFLTINQET
jgi:hypothetical protein